MTGTPMPAEAAPPRVLVAEDDADIRDLVAFKLTRAGFDVVTVPDGAQAWQAIEAEPPAVAVLDVQMPLLSGFDVLRRMRAGAHRAVPVLVLSAKSRDSDVQTGFAIGADDYLVKPFSPKDLVARVEALLAGGS